MHLSNMSRRCNVTAIDVAAFVKNGSKHVPSNDRLYGAETLFVVAHKLEKSGNICLELNLENIRKMILRFLVEKKMSMKKLAKQLGVTPVELQQFSSKKGLARLAHRINLPLVKLYCKTSWS